MTKAKIRNYKSRFNSTLDLKPNPSRSFAVEYFPSMDEEIAVAAPFAREQSPSASPLNCERPFTMDDLPGLVPSEVVCSVRRVCAVEGRVLAGNAPTTQVSAGGKGEAVCGLCEGSERGEGGEGGEGGI
eukprot:TRINITY_DN3890_c0_g2_i1.p1 TRINITY_DN3890_c0_g2~~TRINITY_DN3890_c0_g2_i1.p1  ORF type:complete len:129 (+),score=10.51 TRINITY_DN3890_c0_g2_i1:206-592(+)